MNGVNITENVRKIAAEKRIPLAKVEEIAGISKNSIHKWSKNLPSVDKVARVADVLNVTVDELIK